MDYSKGYTSSFYMTLLDPVTWTDTGRIELVSGSISRSETDLRQSASLSLLEWGLSGDRWIRIYMVSERNGDQDRIPIFTGMATSPSTHYNNGVSTVDLQAYSVLKPAQDVYLQHGWYARKNVRCEKLIRELLSGINAPIIFNSTNEDNYLTDDIIAEDNETELSMIEKILKAVNWVMFIRGDGTIVFENNHDSYSDSSLPVATFSPYNDVIETSFTLDHDWFDCPNVFRATLNEMTAVARDEDPDSPLSVQNRGREIWASEDNVDLLDDVTIAEYARWKLVELQERSETVSYNRRFVPDLNVTNKVRLAYQQVSGDFIVESQTMTLGHALVTQEKIKRSV